ncbi:MAG: hypothetical protein A2087_07760 [Spirochaetes bacterium GWD1_61_31]|nr:MAG: hypothetical protein A2Y37_07710 [Spirochaetes bacterium GWB1_60_80]OHD34298.1 MAG: hypothetical protein A2004_13040 [Spirochaetes bacterium GWC1_61_12]OHD40226.1 MAG: hypothetical protein A2087_07760 [Spirochaetes bacterium GWD1_61_31]OHD45726.1 MAG: hypothetical protein A2Y35_03345 [Spirochaetes bacterium GWE1_60_18]OHD59872.1 MAG: hypothetical protein A2Y32_00040 [Spirochaetes bacterium GWF1_60_12]
MIQSILIFALTYVLISGRRLNLIKIGRPAGVMLGAVLMVLAGVVRPEQTYRLVNWDTIVLLLGMMIITEHLAESGFFDKTAQWLNRRNHAPKALLAILVFGAGILSAFLVNDIVCIFFTPLLVILLRARKLPALPFLLALASAANIGGVMTLTGNPQNMIIGNLSGLSYREYFLLMLPVALLCLAVNYLLLLLIYRRELSTAAALPAPPPPVVTLERQPRLRRSLLVTGLVIVGFFAFHNLPWTAFAGAALLMVMCNRDEANLLRRIDWNLLLFFACLFVVTGALRVSGATALITDHAGRFLGNSPAALWLFGLVNLVASNIFGNVPYVLIIAESIQKMANPKLMWYCLAFSSTVAGNLTLLGSVANVIVAEKARDVHEMGFFDFLKFGLPTTLVTTAIGLGILSLYQTIGWL